MKVVIYNPRVNLEDVQEDSRVYGDHMSVVDIEEDIPSTYLNYDLDISYEIMVRLLGYKDIVDFATTHDIKLEVWTEEYKDNISEEERDKLIDSILDEFDESGIEFVII